MESLRLDELFERLEVLQIRRERRLQQLIRRYIPSGITQSQFNLCKLVKRHGRMTVSDLAGSTGVSLSAITVMADKLCRLGMLVRERDVADRRVVWLALTAEGDRLMSQVLEHWYRILNNFFGRLPAEDVERLVALGERMLEVLGSIDEAGNDQGEG